MDFFFFLTLFDHTRSQHSENKFSVQFHFGSEMQGMSWRTVACGWDSVQVCRLQVCSLGAVGGFLGINLSCPLESLGFELKQGQFDLLFPPRSCGIYICMCHQAYSFSVDFKTFMWMWLCTYMNYVHQMYTGARRDYVSELELQLWAVCGCWESNPGPLQDQ